MRHEALAQHQKNYQTHSPPLSQARHRQAQAKMKHPRTPTPIPPK
jgi:hypothetical protein